MISWCWCCPVSNFLCFVYCCLLVVFGYCHGIFSLFLNCEFEYTPLVPFIYLKCWKPNVGCCKLNVACCKSNVENRKLLKYISYVVCCVCCVQLFVMSSFSVISMALLVCFWLVSLNIPLWYLSTHLSIEYRMLIVQIECWILKSSII